MMKPPYGGRRKIPAPKKGARLSGLTAIAEGNQRLLKQDIPGGGEPIEPHINQHLPPVVGNVVCE